MYMLILESFFKKENRIDALESDMCDVKKIRLKRRDAARSKMK